MIDVRRALRLGRVRPHPARRAETKFECDVCEARARPKPRRVGAMPKSCRMSRVVGIDLIFIKEGGKGNAPDLNVANWGTRYSMFPQ
eukprot:3924108-Pyramimonas_sp.AAC.1